MSRVRGELEVAVQKALRDALVERFDELLDIEHPHDAFDLLSRHEPQRRCHDDAEQAVTADDMSKQLRSLAAAASHHLAVARHDLQRFEIVDERRSSEATPVNV